jgi:ADP-ribose pyrophosphatase
LTPGDTDFDENEAMDIEEYDFYELYEMALSGKIEDGKTLTAILLLNGRRNE